MVRCRFHAQLSALSLNRKEHCSAPRTNRLFTSHQKRLKIRFASLAGHEVFLGGLVRVVEFLAHFVLLLLLLLLLLVVVFVVLVLVLILVSSSFSSGCTQGIVVSELSMFSGCASEGGGRDE